MKKLNRSRRGSSNESNSIRTESVVQSQVFFGYWNPILFIYLIPFMFQTVGGSSPTKAEEEMLALLIIMAISSVFVGTLSRKYGHYYHFFLIAGIFGMVGAGLCYNLSPSSRSAFKIGVRIILGMSFGALIQMPMLAAQANVQDKKPMLKANGLVLLMQRLGGGLGEAVANAILYAQLPIQIQKKLPSDEKYTFVEPQSIYDLPIGPTKTAMLDGLSKTIQIIYVSAVSIYFFALISILCLIK